MIKIYGLAGSLAVILINPVLPALAQSNTTAGGIGTAATTAAVPVAAENTASAAPAGTAADAAVPIQPQPLPAVLKCGVNTFQALDVCGSMGPSNVAAGFRGAYWQCYDDYEEKQYSDACKSSEEWQSYGKKLCAARCNLPQPVPPPQVVKEVPKVVGSGTAVVPPCYANEKLMRQYEDYMAQLRKTEDVGDKKLAQDITNKVIALKKEIAGSQSACSGNVGAAAGGASGGVPAPTATVAKPVPVPTVVNSGQAISDYYRDKFQNITVGTPDVAKQIDALQNLRTEIDGLIQKLIQNKNEVRASEIGGLVPEVKILPGEIRASAVSVRATDKKVIVDVGDKVLSVEPKENEVVINDSGLSVKTESVSIKDNVVNVGNAEVKIAPSAVVEKLQIVPNNMELKEENSKAVYKITTSEQRKLFGFIPVQMEKSVSADAANGEVLSESRPWWSFLATK